jgi:opacity protein-like surface antigen
MITRFLTVFFLTVFLFTGSLHTLAQDKRAQYPGLLSNAYINIDFGYINYPFSTAQLASGYTIENIRVPHLAIRIIPLGYRFNKYLSAQISYMRPFNYTEYKNLNGDKETYYVWMTEGGLTFKGNLPLSRKLSVYGEAGLGTISRKGFVKDSIRVIENANYATYLFGGGLQYHIGNKWDFQLHGNYSPANSKQKQPQVSFIGAGFVFNMHTLPQARVEEVTKAGYSFPKNLLQIGFCTNALGYNVNDLFSEKIPVFWGGNVDVHKGVTLHYQHNVFHTKKVFALDIGASLSYWETKMNRKDFYAISVFPVLRFNLVRTKSADFYLNYSLAGPSVLSTPNLDSLDTGNRFTYQDFMGAGFFAGKKRNINGEIKIVHYSNGNTFPNNSGVKIPLTFSVGYAF